MKKKLLALGLALTMCFSLAACGSDKKDDKKEESTQESSSGDLDAIKAKGTMVIGVTDFEPMDYKDDNGNWIGFDADVAVGFCESIGVEAKFVEIDWDNKILELEAGTIDCVWNGMTLTDEVTSSMNCSNPYCNNAQIVILPKSKADKYKTVDDMKSLTFAVEAGSAGENEAKACGLNTTAVTNQAAALMEVAAGTSDGAIIDSLMAAAMVGEGTSYADLTYTIPLNSEEYGVGFRKGSDVTAKLNEYFISAYEDGSLQKWAEKYGVQAALIDQTTFKKGE